MANLYVTEQGSHIRKTGDRIIVEKNADILLDIPCSKIDSVLIFGNVQFTTQMAHELFEHGIEMALLTRSGRLVGQLTSPVTKNIELRMAQFRRYEDNEFRLDIARRIVRGKIGNCLSLMRSFSYNHPDRDLSSVTEGIKGSLSGIDDADSINALMGIEGSTARAYFGSFGRMILCDLEFPGRVKHPATDPVNALLSFGYTLVFNEIASLLDGLGFDPFLGFFHSVDYGRKSLASDLVEEFRASVDRFTLYLLNNRMIGESDFYTNQKSGGKYLVRDAMKRYFAEYERNINRELVHPAGGTATSLRKCFRMQAERLAAHIRGGDRYEPFGLEA
ncbi:MAG: CRISPR-associated endonuclease Cas1 [Deltaproteobacteria bacterium]|nr:CRISPR-associated endonuclease Cas1 [Deltaproteobacteria bacterium]